MKNIFSKIKLFKAKEKFSFGLDIGTQSIKCVKLKISGDDVELVGFEVEDGQIDPREALKKIKHAQGADLVNISFCGASTIIRYVNFLRMSKNELAGALKFEAQKLIPFSVEEVNLDAEILKDDLPENKMLVLIAAIKKEIISQRIGVLENVGLRVNLVDIDSLALVNAFNFNYAKLEVAENKTASAPVSSSNQNPKPQGAGLVSPNQSPKPQGTGLASSSQSPKSICLLNIGAGITNVNILDNGIVRLSRDIHFGGANFTKKLMDIFEIDFKSAEELKINPPEDKLAKTKASVESLFTNLASEIRTSFDYYESQNISSVAKIYLSGGASKMPGLKEMLGACLGLPVETWDPFKQVRIPDTINRQELDKFYGQFNVAVGLALR